MREVKLRSEWVVVCIGCIWSVTCFLFGLLVKTSDPVFVKLFASAVTITALFGWSWIYCGKVPDFGIALRRYSALKKLFALEFIVFGCGLFGLYGLGWMERLPGYLLFSSLGLVVLILVQRNHFYRVALEVLRK